MSDWKPIETAPKDGTSILGWSDYDGMKVVTWADTSVYGRKDWCCGDCEGDYNHRDTTEPTHWLPLPEPPQEEGK